MKTGVKIYTDLSKVEPKKLKNLNPVLSFHWSGFDFSEIPYGKDEKTSPTVLTNDPGEADFFVLPMFWSYYLWNEKAKLEEALGFAKLAREHGKQVIVWYKGDLIPVIPFENSILFLPGMLKSKIQPNQRACPVFVDDPAPVFGQEKISYREKKEKPSIGFCGYASINTLKFLWSIVRGIQLNAASRFGKYEYIGVPIFPATYTRARALNLLAHHSSVETRFVIRDKFYGNEVQKKALTVSDASQIFYSNIYDTDYTLCLRGYGNWSYRFYETLACGRIPVFIDTDCVLPLEPLIDWKKYCVWIDKSELKYVGEKLADFHAALTTADFVEKQIACRRLWEEHLTIDGFMEHFAEYL